MATGDRANPLGSTDSDLHSVVVIALARVTDRDPASIHGDTALETLGLDSLGFTSLLLEVEEIIGAQLPLEALAAAADAKNFTVVADVVRVLSIAGTSS